AELHRRPQQIRLPRRTSQRHPDILPNRPHSRYRTRRSLAIKNTSHLGIIHLAYTALMLIKAARHITGWVALPATLYLIVLIPIALAWRDSITKLNFRPLSSFGGECWDPTTPQPDPSAQTSTARD
ncbi:MAG TPA: hypothetical protein VNO31_07785, partial [Umezawaea sp.]|nr:hypothetical protein [Umezawaea sp.]